MSELQFFGTVSASISHEIKNVLAIILESSGLMEDLLLMAEKGNPVDPEKLKALAGRVKGQARRADAIVKNMNAFSHTVDYPFRSVDLGEMVGLTVALAARMSSMRGGKVEFEPPGEAVSVATSPFHLHMQLWGCIDSALSHLDENCSLRVQCRKRDQGAAVLFTGLKGTDCGELGVPPPRHQPELLRLLGARVFPSEDGRGFCLDLPGEAPGYRP